MKFQWIDYRKKAVARDVSAGFLDFRSLYFRLWMTFLAFAIILMSFLWLLQITMMDPFYQMSKTKQIHKVGRSIIAAYSQPEELDTEQLMQTMSSLSYDNDMYFYMCTLDNTMVIAPSPTRRFSDSMADSFELIRYQVTQSPSGTISFTIDSPNGQQDTMVYGALVESSYRPTAILCIFAPLSPVDANMDIIERQLMLVTVVSLLLALILSILMAKRISQPLISLKNKASQLARGNYGIEFDSDSYTEIDNLAHTLTYTSKELAKSENLQRDLIANVSHDLRTPLTMVKSYAEMIRDLSGNNAEKRNAHLQVIIDEADRLNRLVSDMLILSKMQSGVLTMKKEPFDLVRALRGLVQTYSLYQEQQGCPVTFESDMEQAFVLGDETPLIQVAANLINNAIRYAADGSSIEVFLQKNATPADCSSGASMSAGTASFAPADTVTLSVQDHGSGIPAEQLSHIWDRYYKYSRTGTRSPSGSSGLGLSIVKQILLLHQAQFGVNSTVGSGSSFWFTLPLTDAPANACIRLSGESER